MAVFQYEALNASGQEIRDSLEAPTKEDAVAKVRGLGYFPTKVVEKTDKKRIVARQVSGARKKKAAGTGFGRVPVKQLTAFTRQLSTLQDAGLPILRSLRILEQQQKPSMLRRVLKEVHDDVEGGSTLSEALTRHPKAFNRLYCNMVAAGEAGGVLDVILQRLAEFMEKGQRLRRKIIGAMVYPSVVITIAAAIVGFIMVQVVPKFRDIFKDFGATLPAPTQILISTSTWFAKGSADVPIPGWVVVLVSPVLIFAIFKLIRQAKVGRYVLDTSLMSTPVAGQIASKSCIARFTRTLGTLIAAGVPILEAINITRDTTGNEVFARMLQKVHDSIREGDTFANPLRASKTVDAIVVNMVDVGEETGELDKMLMKVADNYDEEVDTLVGSLVSLLEPIMVVVLGLIVGYIVVALFLPLVSLIQTLQGGV
ncbi:MAG: type II secretion system F family protein [Phycisphaerae bacterium]|nr:type II secretion system F family protein [Phycisphaerae bacterium]